MEYSNNYRAHIPQNSLWVKGKVRKVVDIYLADMV